MRIKVGSIIVFGSDKFEPYYRHKGKLRKGDKGLVIKNIEGEDLENIVTVYWFRKKFFDRTKESYLTDQRHYSILKEER